MKVCVDCQKEISGKKAVRVREDRVIVSIRWLKRLFKVSKENELYVCEEDMKKHAERRKSFEKSMMIFAVLAAMIFLLLLASIVISGRVEFWTILSAIAIVLLLLFFSLLFKYVPGVEGAEPAKAHAGHAAEKAGKKSVAVRKKR
ncbi:hypothetical protein H0O02_01675 [Candidatus Micrarchaeota archaeon]|nr:hypothetical protein [Candidatus Micrarchaeota archaeon]